MIREFGARPRFSPNDDLIVFDRINDDIFYDVYVCNRDGSNVRAITEGNSGIAQRNNGNARFDPSGQYIIFVSETTEHFMLGSPRLGDPGIGLYSNFWATDLEGKRFWQLTNIPIKKGLFDRTPSYASVNPLFSPDGKFIWTERYAEGGNNNWGKWRLKQADFVVTADGPELRNERVLLTPDKGNYVSAMGFLDDDRLIVAGNLDGQHEYGMDLYVKNLRTGALDNLTNTPEVWEEDASVSPDGRILYMTNALSRFKFNFDRADWPSQPVEREYFLIAENGSGKERITYFNDPEAPEYLNNRVLVAASEFSSDGRYLAGTIGVDHGKGDRRENVELRIVLIEFESPLVDSLQPASAASYATDGVAPGSIVSVFGQDLARSMQAAQSLPLPTRLDDTEVEIIGSAGQVRNAELIYVSPTQVNIVLSDQTRLGPAQIRVRRVGSGRLAGVGFIEVKRIAPAIFSADASGHGVAAGLSVSLDASGAQSSGLIFQCEAAGICTPQPISSSRTAALTLFGVGLRGRRSLEDVEVTMGGRSARALYAGPQGQFLGLDQLNVEPARGLTGLVDISLRVEGVESNRTFVYFE